MNNFTVVQMVISGRGIQQNHVGCSPPPHTQLYQGTINKNCSIFKIYSVIIWDFPGGSDGKESACNAGDPGSILELGRSPGVL